MYPHEMRHLDSGLLRTFLAVAEAGSITGGAGRVHRSQPAVSLQIGRLETVLGRPVFDRNGRGVRLTDTGERLLPVARQVVQRLDRAMAEISGSGLAGPLRIGIPDEHGKAHLSRIVAAFVHDHPNVELSVQCADSTGFPAALAERKLDLAVHEVAEVRPGMTLLREIPIGWVGAWRRPLHDEDPLPVALFDRACWWRDLALRTLETAGRPYRVVLTSESVAGVVAAVEAGIAVGVLARANLNQDPALLHDYPGLGEFPASKLVLEFASAADSPQAHAMADAIIRSYAQPLGR